MTNQPEPDVFAQVTDWVFDLDNTLYPHHSNLFAQIDVRITAYIENLLTLPRAEARALQKQLYLEYGTTLNGLMALRMTLTTPAQGPRHRLFAAGANPRLGAAIRKLPGRKFIFTNGDRGYAEHRKPPASSATSTTSSTSSPLT